MEAMPRPRPPHLHRETNRHGKTVWYVRVDKGPRVRIKADFGSPEFHHAYQAALSDERPMQVEKAARGTLEWLWLLYRQSITWRDLSMATRKQRENIMLHVLKSAGREPLSRIDRKAILKGRDRRVDTPSQAKNFLSTMRGLFTWAVEGDLVRTDPTKGITAKKTKAANGGGFPVWNDEEIGTFERRWPRGTRERVMFDMFLYTGLRRGDAAVVGKQHVRNGVISIQTEKTGMWVTIPILPELQATLDAGPTGDLAFIAASSGNPLTKESLGNLFRDACRAAGINKSAHGLRKAAATNAANHGATVAELEAIFGWAGGQMASLYTRSANRRALSAGAMNKLSRTEAETSIPAPSHKVRAPERKA
ncbi:tyrosine-type recombinase/integrase [Bradyrhizobium japonicum]|uniref:tyrosine-type recombinase/integrase n=1 Tax=Bradyrhizobium japonicum TaxID=375 RepID=UPI0004BBEE42|nr:tyrosine-type recombinase/integrase [Bradyrhizobium japonicum]